MMLARRNAHQCIFCLFRAQVAALDRRQVRHASVGWPRSKTNRGRQTSEKVRAREGSEKQESKLRTASFSIQNSTDKTFQKAQTTISPKGQKRDNSAASEYNGISTPKRTSRKEQRHDGHARADPTLDMKARGELEDSELNPSRPSMTADKLSEIIASRLIALSTSLEDSQRLDAIGIDKATFQKQWSRLKSQVLSRLVNKQDPIGSEFEEEYTINGNQGVEAKLRYLFFDKVFRNKENPSVSNLESQNSVADYRYPGEHFFGARPMKRSIHLHVGPTNSGKTYQALKRLEAVGDGVYAGPLRLLAHEVYSRLNAKGIPCNLITGEERRVHSHIQTGKTSCTVEMVSLNTQLDVAVIDEIQMMSDPARGWAWTEAFLGVRASELHLCGEERVVPLVKELAAMMGEEVTVHTYERLSPLQVQDSSIHGDLTSLRKGDCVICFSRREIHALKANIEIITRKRCAIVYGGLPPESRAQQAKLFNDPNNDYDILVASDAVGMGLNLAIKRVIFYKINKSNGVERFPLKVSEVKQIAGRAGRYRTADQASKSDSDSSTGIDSPVEVVLPPAENLGLVTVFDPDDLDFVRKSMLAKVSPLQTAGLIASNEMITRFSARFPPEVPLSYLLVRLQELMRLPQNGKFHMCSLRSQVQIADSIQHIKGLSLTDRLEFIAAPADSRNDAAFEKMLIACAELVAGEREGDLLEMEEYNLELLDQEPMPDKAMLPKLEHLHRGLVLYLWLSFRFSSYFKCRAIANHAKQLVEKRIENQLALLSLSRRLIRKCTAPDKDSDLERRGLEAVRPLIRTIPYESKSKRPTLRTVESARRGPTSSSLHQHLLLS